MSGGTCMPGTNIDSVEQRQAFDKLMKDKTINDWMHNEFAVEMGWTDKTTFEWLWKKYTGNQYFDPATIKINPKDVKIFTKSIKNEFLPKLGKQAGYFDTYFKLPNKKNHHKVEFKIRKSHYGCFRYYVGTILRSILKKYHGLMLYSHRYDGYASIGYEELEKSFLSTCKKIYTDKEIKQLMRNVA